MVYRRGFQDSAVAIALMLLVFGVGSRTHADIRTVALTGQQIPGAAAGVTFATFSTLPRINAAGRTAFEPTIAGPGVTTSNDTGLWKEGSGTLTLIARESEQAVGMPAGVVYFGSPFRTVLNSSGHVAIYDLVTGSGVTTSNNRGIWTDASGVLTRVVRSGTQAPGAATGVNFAIITPVPQFNDAGNVLFFSSLTGAGVHSGNDQGVWLYAAGSTSLIAREGSPAPGTPAGVTFDNFSGGGLNMAGQTVIYAGLAGDSVDSTNDSGLWVGSPTSVVLKVRAGDAAPNAGADVKFASFSQFHSLNRSSRIAFSATLAGGGVTTANDSSLWSDGSGALQLIAREGDPAPGTPAGVIFRDFSGMHLLNGPGRSAFNAPLAGAGVTTANDVGLWIGSAESLHLVVREGDPAPGMGPGVTIGAAAGFMLNSAGQIALTAPLIGSGVTAANDRAIWASDADGQLHVIVREGDQIEVAPGDSRIVNVLNQFTTLTTEEGSPCSFNDVGQLAFTASFTDGSSGVFVSSLVQTLPGDFTHDQFVNVADLDVWRGQVGEVGSSLAADADHDGDVDGSDFLLWQRNVGGSFVAFRGVPEPASFTTSVLALTGVIAVCRERRSHKR
jgi:hypothetical protein